MTEQPRSTEQTHPASADIDLKTTREILAVINGEDQKIAQIVAAALDEIAHLVDQIYARFSTGGRLFYVGAGTSGRLGVLDASEAPPTFGLPPGRVIGIIAGGVPALHSPSEISEDDPDAGAADLKSHDLSGKDSVVGIAASGRTPYTLGALRYARSVSALTGCIVCVKNSAMAREVQCPVTVETGAEILAGSTRMKAGTAQKLVLNMISTALMIRMGYVYGNLMIRLTMSNVKLMERGKQIIMQTCGVDSATAAQAIQDSGRDLRVAMLMLRQRLSAQAARQKLAARSLRQILGEGR
ncbi:MAG TPA: N-acetylmuramic acid 6-phosphate etherase [Acidobacteriota bacterium]|jgi:N-acetylmuramic acid 6-phosphate etherase